MIGFVNKSRQHRAAASTKLYACMYLLDSRTHAQGGSVHSLAAFTAVARQSLVDKSKFVINNRKALGG